MSIPPTTLLQPLLLNCVVFSSGVFYFLLVFVPVRSDGYIKPSITAFLQCDGKGLKPHLSHCTSSEKESLCPSGQGSFGSHGNNSIVCNFTCRSSLNLSPLVQTDFVDNQNSTYNVSCQSNLAKAFTVKDVNHLIAENDNSTPGSCFNYSLENITLSHPTPCSLNPLCLGTAKIHCEAECSSDTPCEEQKGSFDSTFMFSFLLFLLANIMFSPIFPIMDASSYDVLGKENAHLWGKQRVWGQIGFGMFAISVMFIQEYMSTPFHHYSMLFYIYLVLCMIAALISVFLDVSSNIMLVGNRNLNLLFIIIVFNWYNLKVIIDCLHYLDKHFDY